MLIALAAGSADTTSSHLRHFPSVGKCQRCVISSVRGSCSTNMYAHFLEAACSQRLVTWECKCPVLQSQLGQHCLLSQAAKLLRRKTESSFSVCPSCVPHPSHVLLLRSRPQKPPANLFVRVCFLQNLSCGPLPQIMGFSLTCLHLLLYFLSPQLRLKFCDSKERSILFLSLSWPRCLDSAWNTWKFNKY